MLPLGRDFDPNTALAWLKNPGPHGFSEMLYEFSSATANNGSGFEGLGDNTPFWNISTGLCMLLGRYIPINRAARWPECWPPSLRHPRPEARSVRIARRLIHVGAVVVLGLLMFMPVAVLSPIAEHLALQ